MVSRVIIFIIIKILICIQAQETLDGVAQLRMPFMVSVQYRNRYGTVEHICGGSIIHERIVLTAAHCFINHGDVTKMSIVGGTNTIYDGSGQRFSVKAYTSPEHFKPLRGSDVALVKITSIFPIDGVTYRIIPYQTSINQDEMEFDGYLLGWGGKSGRSSRRLELISFATIPTYVCLKKGFRYITNTELCAVNYNGRGACDGDSGGPLVSKDFGVQYALLSYGRTPCRPRRIYAFTHMRTMRRWIDYTMNWLIAT